MEYDKEVQTITDILNALEQFSNKNEIIEAIKPSLYDIETDWHTEEFYRNRVAFLELQLEAYKDKEDKLREYINNEKNSYYEKDEDNAIKIITLTKFLQILNEGSDIQWP